MKILLALIIALLMANNSYAYNDFKCVVLQSFTLQHNGKLSAETITAKRRVNKEFVVNRKTGQITGGDFVNTMSGQMPVVYTHLPRENSFNAITIYKPHFSIDYLKISEYVKSDEKPFMYTPAWSGGIVTGVCTYY